MLKGSVGQATLPAADVDRANGCWAKLGLAPTIERPASLECQMVGGSGFSVYPTGYPTRGGHTQIHFKVTAIESEDADLIARVSPSRSTTCPA